MIETHLTMNFFEHSYFRTSKNLTRLIGTWPYQTYWESRICASVIIFLSISQFIAEVIGVIIYHDDTEFVLDSIAPFLLDIILAVKYVNAVLNLKTIMKLLDRVKDDWNIYVNEEEKRILDKYAYIGKLVVHGYIATVYTTAVVLISETLIPKWMNFFLELNETVKNKYPVPISWGIIDMDENFYSVWCYESICIMGMLTITVANDSMFIVFLQHACALFAIVGRQLENVPSQRELEKDWKYSNKFRKTNEIQYDYYVMCIRNHKRAIQFAKLLEDMYVWCFAVVIVVNMLIMSVTAAQVTTQSLTIQRLIGLGMFTFAQMMHLFFDCYLSQQLTDNSLAIDQCIMYSKWYTMSLKTQNLIILVTLRSREACKLTAGKLVLLSMETFGKIVKTSATYFTILVSMR